MFMGFMPVGPSDKTNSCILDGSLKTPHDLTGYAIRQIGLQCVTIQIANGTNKQRFAQWISFVAENTV